MAHRVERAVAARVGARVQQLLRGASRGCIEVEVLVVGVLGDHQSGAIGNIGDTCTVLSLLQIPTLFLIWRYLPETKGTVLQDRAE